MTTAKLSGKNLSKFNRDRAFRRFLKRLPGDAIKILTVLLFLFPFYWMFVTSFKHYIEAIQTPPTLWPHDFTFDNFINIAKMEVNLTQYAVNSVVVTGSVILLQLVLMIPAAYGFARYKFKGQGILFGIVLVAFMIPGQVTYISIYLMFARAHMINTLWPQILPAGASAFGIFMLRQSFKQIPDEIVECARLDNASEVQIMLQIMMPMCKSAVITIAMFTFVGQWNQYFWPLVMTQSEKVRPLTLAIEKIKDAEQGLNWNTIMAANMILVVPVLIVFIFCSKKIIQGFAYRGMK